MEEQTTPVKMGIFNKLYNVQQAGLKFTKDKKGVHGAKYVTLDNMNETLAPILKKEKLVIVHTTAREADGQFVVKTMVIDTDDNSSVVSSFPIDISLEPQKIGGLISYAKRYNEGELFNVITDEDDDGEASSPKNVSNAKSRL